MGLEIDWELLFTIIVFKTFRKESFRIIPMDNLEFNAFRGISKSGSVKVNPVGIVGRSIEIIAWLHGAVQRRDAITWRRRSKADPVPARRSLAYLATIEWRVTLFLISPRAISLRLSKRLVLERNPLPCLI